MAQNESLEDYLKEIDEEKTLTLSQSRLMVQLIKEVISQIKTPQTNIEKTPSLFYLQYSTGTTAAAEEKHIS